MAKIARGSLVIADLGGYSRYLREIDLETVHVVGDLLEVVASALEPLEIAKLEGDAVFAHDASDGIPGARMLEMLENCYRLFAERAWTIGNDGHCGCPACAKVPELDLKFVVHHGDYAIQQLAGHIELVGPEVILVHRLLKNGVMARLGHSGYALLTRHWADATGAHVGQLERHVEDYDGTGTVAGFVLPLQSAHHPVGAKRGQTTPDASNGCCTYEPEPVVFREPSR